MLEGVLYFSDGGEKAPVVWRNEGRMGNLHDRRPPQMVLPCHEPLSLSKAALADRWRFMRKLFSERDFALILSVERCSWSAPVATGASVIAACRVVSRRACGSAAPPTVVISAASRGDWITATGRSGIAVATAEKA